jgi:hypothetical protein
MKNLRHRITMFSLLLSSGGVLGACGQSLGTRCEAGGGDGCVAAEVQSAELLPPEGYVVKWSTCTHYIEGNAKLHNNSRVVRVRSDGTVPVQRAEPTGDLASDLRRVVLAKLPQQLLGGEGLLRQASSVRATPSAPVSRPLSTGGAAGDERQKVSFVKLGQAISTNEADGSIAQWVVSSEPLGEPVQNENGKLEYQDTCFRNPNVAGNDTTGYIAPGTELAPSCLVEGVNQSYNAYSAYGYLPLMNYTTTIVPTANDPATLPLPEVYATYLGFDGNSHNYTGLGAALNDINGTERDAYTEYYPYDIYCHMIVSGGLEVPGAKRPATKSFPLPGVVVGTTLNVWRPVNLNVTIANDQEARAPDPVEPAPPPADVPVDAAEALVPL